MINRIVGLHFSPRGGTATITNRIINELADRMSKECEVEVSCEEYDLMRQSQKTPSFDEDTVVVIGMPVRVGKLPLPAIKVLKGLQGSGAMTMAVVSYGARSYGNALYELYHFAEECGFKVIGVGAFVAKHAGLTSDILTRPNESDLEDIREFANAITNKLKRLSGCEIEGLRIKPAPIQVKGHLPVHRISRLSPKAAAVAENTFEKMHLGKSESEWYL